MSFALTCDRITFWGRMIMKTYLINIREQTHPRNQGYAHDDHIVGSAYCTLPGLHEERLIGLLESIKVTAATRLMEREAKWCGNHPGVEHTGEGEEFVGYRWIEWSCFEADPEAIECTPIDEIITNLEVFHQEITRTTTIDLTRRSYSKSLYARLIWQQLFNYYHELKGNLECLDSFLCDLKLLEQFVESGVVCCYWLATIETGWTDLLHLAPADKWPEDICAKIEKTPDSFIITWL